MARTRGGDEDKGRWFALLVNRSSLRQAARVRAASPQGYGVTDDSAFKSQVRARMAETGEKYTVARRMVTAAAQGDAIRGAVQRSLERAIGLSAVEVDLAADRVHVTIRAARPDVAWGFLGPAQPEDVWRETGAERLRGELEELTGKRVRLDILPVTDGSSAPSSPGGQDAGQGLVAE